jgi:hypothetical protein
MIIATILALYTYKNSQFFGESLTFVLYGLVGFVFVFAFGKNLALIIYIRRHQEKEYSKLHAERYTDSEMMLNNLHDLIKHQKSSLFRRKYKYQIISIINFLVSSRKDAIDLIDSYRKKYDKNITSELEGLTSSYNEKLEYLKKFVDYGLVEEEYPHRLVEDDADSE